MKAVRGIVFAMLVTACAQQQPEETKLSEPIWQPLERVTHAHLRGLYAVSDSIAWASGTEGTVLRTVDGSHWTVIGIPTAEDQDLRDIHAFSSEEAIAMSSGNGVSIYRTADGGKTWSTVYEDTNRHVFYDGLDLLSSGYGIAYGDPIDGRMAMLVTYDHGRSWKPLSDILRPLLDSNEAGYAASGTGISLTNDRCWIATGGGPVSRVFAFDLTGSLQRIDTVPIESSPGSGIFSIVALSDSHLVAVGGDYRDSTDRSSNCAVKINGHSWMPITVQDPRGYRSCVASDPDGDFLITVGRTGSDYSTDGGLTWKALGDEGFFTCTLTKKGGWAAGRGGKMARLVRP